MAVHAFSSSKYKSIDSSDHSQSLSLFTICSLEATPAEHLATRRLVNYWSAGFMHEATLVSKWLSSRFC